MTNPAPIHRAFPDMIRDLTEGRLTVRLEDVFPFLLPRTLQAQDWAPPVYAVHFSLDGRGRHYLDGHWLPCHPGTVVFTTPEYRHAYELPKDHRGFHLRFRLTRGERPVHCRTSHFWIPQAWPILELLKPFQIEVKQEGPWQGARIKSLLTLLLTSLESLSHRPAPRGPTLTQAQMETVLRHLQYQPTRRVPTGALARVLHLSPGYFRRVFHNTHGMSVRAYVSRERLRHAHLLLRTGEKTVSSVAREVGYDSLPSFARQYRALFGAPPGKHRAY